MVVRLHVEELVLHGFDPRDRHAIGDALQTELSTLFAAQPIRPSQSASIDAIDAGAFPVDNIRSAAAPREIAAAVHREVAK